MNHSTPGLPGHHKLPEFTQTHAHQVSDAWTLVLAILVIEISFLIFWILSASDHDGSMSKKYNNFLRENKA